jgi:hypothetical protein
VVVLPGMKDLKSIEKKITKIKADLMALGEMHPGSLSQQFNVCGVKNCRCKDKVNPQKHGPYHQLSYVIKGKSTSRFIHKDHLEEVQRHVENYKQFKALTTEWKELAAEYTKMKLDLEKQNRKQIKSES